MLLKQDLNRYRDIPFSWVRRFIIVKMSILSKLICRFNAVLMKPSWFLFAFTSKTILNLLRKFKGPRIVLKKINKFG